MNLLRIEQNRSIITPSINDGSFEGLPDETIINIFKHLDVRSLRQMILQNRRLSQIAKDDPLWYGHLNLHFPTRSPFVKPFFSHYSKEMHSFLEATKAVRGLLDEHKTKEESMTDASIEALCKKHPLTRMFSFYREGEDGNETTPLSEKSLKIVRENCLFLEDISFESTKPSEFDHLGLEQVNSFFAKYPTLKTLKIKGFSDMIGSNFVRIFSKHAELEHIIYGNYFITDDFFSAFANWPKLRHLHLTGSGNSNLSDKALEQISTRKWHSLDLRIINHHFSLEAVERLLQQLTEIKHLGFSGSSSLEDSVFIDLIKNSPDLEHLRLDNQKLLSNQSADQLLKLSPKLAYLNLKGVSEAFLNRMLELYSNDLNFPLLSYCSINDRILSRS